MNDHLAVLCALAEDMQWRRGVEVGLGHGLLFSRLVDRGIDMIGVDMGLRADRKLAVDSIAGKVIWKPSVEAAKEVPDGWADFIFIDAGHSYEAVRADIDAWKSKVCDGGWFGGHDYHPHHPGVMRAVDEVFPSRKLLDGWIWQA